ncbi:PAS domain-containing protein [Fodinicurvata halophila]|uniref:PAS domain-containing protein n=1 Tax=Fodinicurvata halophila TaxID=1419723 RepID=UPI0036273B43
MTQTPEDSDRTEDKARKIDPGSVLGALALPVFVLDENNRFASLNLAAEQLFAASAATLTGREITSVLPSDNPLLTLVEQVRRKGYSISESDITLESPRLGHISWRPRFRRFPKRPTP